MLIEPLVGVSLLSSFLPLVSHETKNMVDKLSNPPYNTLFLILIISLNTPVQTKAAVKQTNSSKKIPEKVVVFIGQLINV